MVYRRRAPRGASARSPRRSPSTASGRSHRRALVRRHACLQKTRPQDGLRARTRPARIAAMLDELVVAARFCGPPGIANGGYVAGLLARGIAGPVEVTLRAPTPLDTRVKIEARADGARSLQLAGAELARAAPRAFELELRAAPGARGPPARAGGRRGLRPAP